MKSAISPAALASHAVNAVIVIGAAALLYAGWHYLHKVGYRFDAGAVIVGIIAAAAAGLLTCLVVRLEVRRNIALLTAAICLSFIAGNYALKLSARPTRKTPALSRRARQTAATATRLAPPSLPPASIPRRCSCITHRRSCR